MAYSVCGRETGSTTAPRRSSSAIALRTAASTSGCMPSAKYSRGMPRRRPRTPLPSTSPYAGTGRGEAVESAGTGSGAGGVIRGVVPRDGLEDQGRVADVACQRPHLVERRRVGDHAVARHPAVGGLEADDTAERGRQADRAAGVGAERRRHLTGCYRRAGAARRATGYAV